VDSLAASSAHLAARWLKALRADGDCYEANGKYILFEHPGDPSIVLVHGEVTGTGMQVLGLNYGHAWIEEGNTVLDFSNGRTVRMSKAEFYKRGSISKNNNMHRYTYHEAAEKAVLTGVWGPWDLKTSTGY
jgi:hypothetical protein